jgi:hypothetical protein
MRNPPDGDEREESAHQDRRPEHRGLSLGRRLAHTEPVVKQDFDEHVGVSG